MTKSVVNWLEYRSYEHNRLRRPDIAYFRWRRIFKDAIVFEEIFEQYIKTQREGTSDHVPSNPIRTN